MNRNRVAIIVFLLLSAFAFSCTALPPHPEYWPVCGSPQNIAPMQEIGGSAGWYRSSVAWNGKSFAIVWIDCPSICTLHFRKFFSDGTPAGAEIVLSTLSCEYAPKIVWNGSGYAVAWAASVGSERNIYFLRLDAGGNIITGPIQMSTAVLPLTSAHGHPDMAWSGSGYCVTWSDGRNGTRDIFATLLDANGSILYHDIPVCEEVLEQERPRIAWSPAIGGSYQIVWMDGRSGTDFQIWGDLLSPEGWTNGNIQLTNLPAGENAYYPVVAAMSAGIGLVWNDSRDSGSLEIYFARISNSGTKVGVDVRVTNDTGNSILPSITWTGAEFGVFWRDNRSGNGEIWFQRISSSGALLGGNTQVTSTSMGMDTPDAAFAKYGYLATSTIYGGLNFTIPWGCSADVTPPSCPESPMAYSITGTTATISWLPSVEDFTDIAYYILYRNNTEIAKTSDNFYADSGLSLGTTYKYDLRAVNAAGLTTTGCTSASMYLKTNSTLTLKLDKSDPDAHLYWNDEGMNSYNIFRGTSPQVMNLIGSTGECSADDANVILDNINYFYTVDDPGQ